MKKGFLFIAVLLTLSAVLVAPISANKSAVFIGYGAMGLATVTHGEMTFVVEAIDFKFSTFGHADFLSISTLDGVPIVAVTDDIEMKALVEDMFEEVMPIFPYFEVKLVENCDLLVYSWFRRVTLILSESVDCYTPVGDPITIHPFTIKFRGCGWGEWSEEPPSEMSGYAMTAKAKNYGAIATMICAEEEWTTDEASVGCRMKVTIDCK